jgi:hypothetical protein
MEDENAYLVLLPFLGAFAKLRKGNISFVISVPVRMEQLGSHWMDFN